MGELFVPFARLGAEESGVIGTGLGLALSQRLVEAMGGALSAESQWGEGSTFWLELTRSSGAVARTPRTILAAGTGESTGIPASVLCIEDNVDNLSLIEAVLGLRPAITLMSAVQGRIGLDLAFQHEPDLMLLDMNLPDLPGIEVLRRLRADRRTHAMPVIVISADANPDSIKTLMDAGARAYITKPIDVEEFLRAVDAALTSPRH
jgi:CheY-like chemotaxis protein